MRVCFLYLHSSFDIRHVLCSVRPLLTVQRQQFVVHLALVFDNVAAGTDDGFERRLRHLLHNLGGGMLSHHLDARLQSVRHWVLRTVDDGRGRRRVVDVVL